MEPIAGCDELLHVSRAPLMRLGAPAAGAPCLQWRNRDPWAACDDKAYHWGRVRSVSAARSSMALPMRCLNQGFRHGKGQGGPYRSGARRLLTGSGASDRRTVRAQGPDDQHRVANKNAAPDDHLFGWHRGTAARDCVLSYQRGPGLHSRPRQSVIARKPDLQGPEVGSLRQGFHAATTGATEFSC